MSSSCCSRGEGNEFFLKKTIFREYTKVINLLLLLLGTWLSLGKRERKTQARQQCIECTRKGERGDRRMEKVTGNGTNCPLPYLANKAQLAPTATSTYVPNSANPFFVHTVYAKRRGWALTIIRPSFLCCPVPLLLSLLILIRAIGL